MKFRFIPLLVLMMSPYWLGAATADDDAYESELDTLQQRIEAAKQGEQSLSARERELEAQLAAMQKRAEEAEGKLATCQARLKSP